MNYTPTPFNLLGPQKFKNAPKIRSKSNVRIDRNKENKETENCSTTWVDHKTVFELYPNPKNSQLGPKKVKMTPKIKSKSKVRIEENIENKSYSTSWVVPKTVF